MARGIAHRGIEYGRTAGPTPGSEVIPPIVDPNRCHCSKEGTSGGPEEKARLIENAKHARSPHIYPALMLAVNAGMRDAEMKTLTWAQVNFEKRYLAVGRSKTDAGEGRTIPLNSALFDALSAYSEC